jgi:hyperosmotically inducible protein
MRKAYTVAMVVVLAVSWAVAARAQGTQQPASNQAANGMQPQGSEEAVSPEVQAKLVQGIRRAILTLPYYGVFDNLAFRLQGRTVILEGQVLRPSLKPDAERAVKKVEGVDKVINNIEVLPPGQIDESIRQAVYKAIYGYGPLFKYSNDKVNPPIHIIVRNARVTLEGVVDTETDKGLCTLRANQVSSVLSVTNNLRVLGPSKSK